MGWADNSGKQGTEDGMDQGNRTSSPGPVCNDSKEEQQRLMGESGPGEERAAGEGRSRSQCGTSPLWG